MSFASSSNVGLYIHPRNGNVGIGTGVPLNALHVRANTTGLGVVIDQAGTGGILDVRKAGGSKVVVDGNGNLGIGTTNPQTTLDVSGNISSSGIIGAGTQFYASQGDTETVPGYSWNGDTNTGIYRPAADTISVVTNGVARMTVLSDGNVGIGTTIPTQKLYVNGNATISGWIKGTTPFYSASLPNLGNPFTGVATYTSGVNTNVSSWYNNTTGKFTPLVSGNYYVFASALTYSSGGTSVVIIRKNGNIVARGYYHSVTTYVNISQSIIIQMNGTTDYIDIYLTNTNATDPSPSSMSVLNIYLIAS